MINLQCDYLEGCHPLILEKMAEANYVKTPGYGKDPYCQSAAEKIKEVFACPEAEIHFLVGGTQANLTVIASLLRSHQGALCAEEGHIATHETGAIEATGHKVLPLPCKNGKITAEQVEIYCRQHFASTVQEHTVQPGMVYISFPTECGALYSKAELEQLHAVCRAYEIPLYLDGARLGYGLASEENDLAPADLARLCDIFYIGGTKCGALFGEAVVIANAAYQKDFRYLVKQKGGMLAKGRMLGIQFDTLFTDGLYFEICRKAVEQAAALRRAFQERGVQMYGDSPTNQQFPILSKAQAEYLGQKYIYEIWGEYDETHTVVRFCTSWATGQEEIDGLLAYIQKMPEA